MGRRTRWRPGGQASPHGGVPDCRAPPNPCAHPKYRRSPRRAMPEGPEVQRSADLLHDALQGRVVRQLDGRTKLAKAWLKAHPGAFEGRRVERVWAHGKHLVGQVEGDLFFHSHYLMWGRWTVVAPDDEAVTTRDRRERARVVTDDAVALLLSAPTFTVGRGDPYAEIPALEHLGPDILPERGAFDADAFLRRLDREPDRTIGAALLDQTVAAGIGNYLRAELLYECRTDPWRLVRDLDATERERLVAEIPRISARAYREGGRTVPEAVQARQAEDRDLRYSPYARPWNTKHWVFRRTNLPCLTCDDTVRQKHQLTREWTDETTGEPVEKKRIIYFCPTCQGVAPEYVPKANPHRDRRPPDSEWETPDDEADPSDG